MSEGNEQTNSTLQILRDNRAILLGCEAVGWLHMAGKAHLDFLNQVDTYKFKEWRNDSKIDWDNRLSWLRTTCSKVELKLPSKLTDFCEKFDSRDSEDLVALLQAGHGMSSGIEKQSYPQKSVEYLAQAPGHMWLTTAFGRPVCNLRTDPPPQVLQVGEWDALIDRIGNLLQVLRELGADALNRAPDDVDGWANWREGAIGRSGWLRTDFSSTLAETRLPNNDVTLWDQSYVAAALFKAAVAGRILSPSSDWGGLKGKTRWRVLSVAFGAEHYESRAVRIGDWAGARQQIGGFYDDVCRLVEVELAVGSLVYRDDRVLVFTFPGLRDGSTESDPNGSVTNALAEHLRFSIQDEIDAAAKSRNFETPPRCRISASTRSFIPMAKEIADARAAVETPIHRSWTINSPANRSGHICRVCQVRHEDLNNSQHICGACDKRRKGRLSSWLAEGGDTIWIDEVADKNNRAAVLTFSLDLSRWLDGSSMDSLRAQSVAQWAEKNPVLDGLSNPVDLKRPFRSLSESVTQYVKKPVKQDGKLSDPLLSRLNNGFRHETDLAEFFDKVVEDRSDAPAWTDLDDAGRARWLVHQILRKNASPGRVHRFWRTTEQFFSELLEDFRAQTLQNANDWRIRRITLTPAGVSDWVDKETYTAAWRQAPLELLYQSATKDFLSISNLARILKPAEDVAVLNGLSFDLTSDSGKSKLTIQAAERATGTLAEYSPLIVLEQSPERFRVLVPLDAVNGSVQTAVAKWQSEMGRVWDRLPLRVGVVAFPRKTTYQAVVEAVRNLEDGLAGVGDETWGIQRTQTRDGVTAISVQRADGEPDLVTAPTRLADGREDVFYTYCRVTDRTCRTAHDFHAPERGEPGSVYRRMADLRPGDEIAVTPASIAAMYLESTASRFDPTDICALSDWTRMAEIWRMVRERAPSLTAVRGVWAAMEDARDRWRESDGMLTESAIQTWLGFTRALLATEWGICGAALDMLVDAARSGVLRRALTWHLHVLKLGMEDAE